MRSLVPRPFARGGERVWYLLCAHARNFSKNWMLLLMGQSRLVAVIHIEETCGRKEKFDCTADSLQSLVYEPFEILRVTRVH